MTNKSVKLSNYGAPTFWVIIDELRIPVAVPDLSTTEVLIEKLNLLAKANNGLTEEEYNLTFEMLATLLSNNHNFRRFTADELKEKNITVSQIIGILTDWLGFISELASSKN